MSSRPTSLLRSLPHYLWKNKSGHMKTHRCLSSFSVQTTSSSASPSRPNLHWEEKKNAKTWSRRILIPLVSVGAVLFGYAVKKKHKGHCESKPRRDVVAPVTEDRPVEVIPVKDSPVDTPGNISLQEAVNLARDLSQRIKDESGSPGLAVAVFVDGKEIWAEGLGYADIENRVRCHPDSVMRIASISKPIAMTIVAKLWEKGKLDLDKPVQHYVPSWPEKTFQGQKVTITTRQLLSHLSGVRHYDKNCGRKQTQKQSKETKLTDKEGTKSAPETSPIQQTPVPELELKEFYMKKRFASVTDALEIFKNDELCSLPGTTYLYTTYGWTLISAVVEGASDKKFPDLVKELFKDLGMESSFLDENEPVIYNRARHYLKNKRGRVVNAPYVDLSCKWAGGGFISSARDICRFGNAMLYSYQNRQDSNKPGHHNQQETNKPGYLKPGTMDMIWTPVKLAKCDWDTDGYYGMGWGVVTPGGQKHGQCQEVRQYFSHTGGAIGASSAFVILPRQGSIRQYEDCGLPQGVVVTMIANTSAVGLNKTAIKIAKIFERV